MIPKHADSSLEGFFWKDTDLKNKMIVGAGTGFGMTRAEISKRSNRQGVNGTTIVSIDISLKLSLLLEGC